MDTKDINVGTVMRFTGTVEKVKQGTKLDGFYLRLEGTAEGGTYIETGEAKAAELVSQPRVTLTAEQREAVKERLESSVGHDDMIQESCNRAIDSFAE